MTEKRRQPGRVRGDSFPTTQWSVILAAGDSQSPGGRTALATLCRDYWLPVYSYIRRRGADAAAAEDLTQAFFTHLLEKRSIKAADRTRGRFRAFLLTAVKHFLANERDRERAKKRGGGRAPLPLDIESGEARYGLEPMHDVTPERVFEKRWALALLDRVLARLGEEMSRSGHRQRFERLQEFLVGGDGGEPYAQVGVDLGMSASAVKVAVHRMRRRFAALLREEVGRTVDDQGEVEAELQHLLHAAGSG
jgi:RNA polymerase sigma-70 factor (ECF subfamily)